MIEPWDKAVINAVAWAIEALLQEALRDECRPVSSPLHDRIADLRALRTEGTKIDAYWWGYRDRFYTVMDELSLSADYYRDLIFNEWDGWEERIG